MVDKCTYLEGGKCHFKRFVSQIEGSEGAQTASERSGSDIPAFRPNHDHVPITRRGLRYLFQNTRQHY